MLIHLQDGVNHVMVIEHYFQGKGALYLLDYNRYLNVMKKLQNLNGKPISFFKPQSLGVYGFEPAFVGKYSHTTTPPMHRYDRPTWDCPWQFRIEEVLRNQFGIRL